MDDGSLKVSESELDEWEEIKGIATLMNDIYKTTENPDPEGPAKSKIQELDNKYHVKLEYFDQLEDIRGLKLGYKKKLEEITLLPTQSETVATGRSLPEGPTQRP
jgi:hypothetical protein